METRRRDLSDESKSGFSGNKYHHISFVTPSEVHPSENQRKRIVVEFTQVGNQFELHCLNAHYES
jgi:hypothetical protein